MATDYHIYIHGSTGGESNGDSTKPFSSEKTSAFKPKQNSIEAEDSDIIDEGAAALGKISGVVALATAIYKTTDKVLSTGFSHLREYTGHYEYEMQYNNFKTMIRHTVHPIGLLKETLHRDFQFRKENRRIAEESKIIGRTIYDDVKIGV